MCKRDYVLFADVLNFALKYSREPVAAGTTLFIMDHIADALAVDNAAFDRPRFIAAVTKGTDHG